MLYYFTYFRLWELLKIVLYCLDFICKSITFIIKSVSNSVIKWVLKINYYSIRDIVKSIFKTHLIFVVISCFNLLFLIQWYLLLLLQF